jgi:hypothetical protein
LRKKPLRLLERDEPTRCFGGGLIAGKIGVQDGGRHFA